MDAVRVRGVEGRPVKNVLDGIITRDTVRRMLATVP